jgi:hypothetical protein
MTFILDEKSSGKSIVELLTLLKNNVSFLHNRSVVQKSETHLQWLAWLVNASSAMEKTHRLRIIQTNLLIIEAKIRMKRDDIIAHSRDWMIWQSVFFCCAVDLANQCRLVSFVCLINMSIGVYCAEKEWQWKVYSWWIELFCEEKKLN